MELRKRNVTRAGAGRCSPVGEDIPQHDPRHNDDHQSDDLKSDKHKSDDHKSDQHKSDQDKCNQHKSTKHKLGEHESDKQHLTGGQRISKHMQNSPICQLWRQSVAKPDKKNKFAAGIDRPLNGPNIIIALKLMTLLARPCLAALSRSKRNSVFGFLLRRILVGFVPAAKYWARAQLMDQVQISLTGDTVDWGRMSYLLAIQLLLSSFDSMYAYLADSLDSTIEYEIGQELERAYMSAQMSTSIPSMGTPVIAALMLEGAVFVGIRDYYTGSGKRGYIDGPFNHLKHLLHVIRETTHIVSLALLLGRSISKSTHGHVRWVFIALCMGPALFRRLGGLFFRFKMRKSFKDLYLSSKLRDQERRLKTLGSDGEYKQENVLFGLRDWVLEKLNEVKRDMRANIVRGMERQQASELYLAVGKNSMEIIFYIAMVSRVFGGTISLATTQLCQNVVRELSHSLRSIGKDLERSFQTIFYLAAFVECINIPHDLYATSSATKLTSYETTRPDSGGMAIVARNLSFTYPSHKKPTLRNINLAVPAGQTLAIVGFNGGGKTTLTKVLMGLFDCKGTLLINGTPIRAIDKQSLYARTSCLFQDYNRYPVTLRENVGVGRVDKANDLESIWRAMERGTADAVAEQLGSIETVLHPKPGNAGTGMDDIDPVSGSKAKTDTMPKTESGNEAEASPEDVTPTSQVALQRNGIPPEPLSEKDDMKRKETSHHLSGGQWQRVALARAFLRAEEADLVVFDEPSASLDPRAEAALFERIHRLSTSAAQKPTTIYISHRFSTGRLLSNAEIGSSPDESSQAVRKADQIAVVEDGTIIENGSHAELMHLGGRYAELFNLQKEGYQSD